LSLHFALSSLVFIGKKTREKEDRAATVLPPLHRPPNTWKILGKWGVLGRRPFELKGGRKAVKIQGNATSFPCFSSRLREEESLQYCSKQHRFGFFLWRVN
jgi:hypothetical protein